MAPCNGFDRAAVERFDYSRVGNEWAVLRLLARLGSESGVPSDAGLLIKRGHDLEDLLYPARACSYERRLIRLSSGEGAPAVGSELLWRASFALPLEVVEFQPALFDLVAGGRLALALPAPDVRILGRQRPLPLAAELRGRRIMVSGVRHRAVALATTVAVTTTSTPVVALAAAGNGHSAHGAQSQQTSATQATLTMQAAAKAKKAAELAAQRAAAQRAAAQQAAKLAAAQKAAKLAAEKAAQKAAEKSASKAAKPTADASAALATSKPAPTTGTPAPTAPQPGTTPAPATPATTPAPTTPAATPAPAAPAPAATAPATTPAQPTTTPAQAPATPATPGTPTAHTAPATKRTTTAPLTKVSVLSKHTKPPAHDDAAKLHKLTHPSVTHLFTAKAPHRAAATKQTTCTAPATTKVSATAEHATQPLSQLTVQFPKPPTQAAGTSHASKITCTPGRTKSKGTTPSGKGKSTKPGTSPNGKPGAPSHNAHRVPHVVSSRPQPRSGRATGGITPLGGLSHQPPTRLAGTVPTWSSTPGFTGPASWAGTVSTDPALSGALGNLSNLLANGDHPPQFLIPIYMEAGRKYSIPWQVLAAINAVESDYGRDLSTSSAGAIGWMQFEPSTWKQYGVAADGHSVPNPYDPRDAIFSAARYLAAAGGARDISAGIFSYNHAQWYVTDVLQRAQAIATHVAFSRQTTSKKGTVSVYFATNQRKHPVMRFKGGLLSHYTRLIAAANMVSAADFPYLYGGGHEQPARFGPFDCSGSVSYVMQQAGYKVPTTVSGDIPSWHFPAGPGRVTIFYNPVHTYMRIGNRFFGTSGFARPGGGAGWFDVDKLPADYMSQFRVVHVPKLGGNSFAPPHLAKPNS